VREHFYELGLDPQMAVLDEGETCLLADETLDEELQGCYGGQDEFAESVKKLIRVYGGGRDEKIRQMVLRLHHYAQTRPDAEGWLARQIENSTRPSRINGTTGCLRGFATGAMNGCRRLKICARAISRLPSASKSLKDCRKHFHANKL